MKIITKAEATAQSTHSVLIYGDPGTGKTSFATSTPNPLLLPFDKSGALRAIGNPDLVELSNWQDAIEFADQPLGTFDAYDTVVVDTIGKMLESAGDHVKKANPAVNIQRGSNALSMNGYAALKSEFQSWFKAMIAHGLNIVLVAHAKEQENLVRPDIVGGSYAIVMQEVDAAAYMHISNDGARVADFAPTANALGKDCAKLGRYPIAELPTGDYTQAGTMQHVIDSIRGAIQANIESTKKAKAAFIELKEMISNAINDSDNLVGAYNAALAARDEAADRQTTVSERAMLNKQVSMQFTKLLASGTVTTDLEGYNYILESILNDDLLQKDNALKSAFLESAKSAGYSYNTDKKLFV